MPEKGPQYFSDEFTGPPKKSWPKNQHDPGGAADLFAHDDGLFNENETRSGGDLINPVTGEKYDNSSYTGVEDLTIVDPVNTGSSSTDVLGPLEEPDLTDKWLEKHDRPASNGKENVA